MENSGQNSFPESGECSSVARKRQRVVGVSEGGKTRCNEALRLQVEKLEAANKTLTKKLRRAEDRIWAYELEQKSHENELKRMSEEHQKALADAESRQSSIQEGARKLLATVQRHEKTLPELERRNSELQDEKDQLASDFEEREQLVLFETDSLKKQLTNCETRCGRLESDNSMLLDRLRDIGAQLVSVGQKKDRADHELGVQTDIRCQLQQKVEVLQAHLDHSTRLLKDASLRVTGLEREKIAVDELNRSCRGRVEFLGAEVVKYQRSDRYLRQVVTGLKSKIVALEQEERRKSLETGEEGTSVELARKRAAELDDVTIILTENDRQHSPPATGVCTEGRPKDADIGTTTRGSLGLVDTSIQKSWTRLCQVLDFYKTTIGDTVVTSPTAVLQWFKEQLEEYRYIDASDLDCKVKRSLLVNRLGLYTVLEHTLIDLVAEKHKGGGNETTDDHGTTSIKAIIAAALEQENKVECVKKDPEEIGNASPVDEEVVVGEGAVSDP